MAAPIPSPYEYRHGAWYFNSATGAGPYIFDGVSTFSLMATDASVSGSISQLPASLGPKAASASLSVVQAIATLASISGTVTSGGAAQNAAAANATRVGFEIQNLSTGDLWFSTLAAAVASQPSYRIPPGAFYSSPAGGPAVPHHQR